MERTKLPSVYPQAQQSKIPRVLHTTVISSSLVSACGVVKSLPTFAVKTVVAMSSEAFHFWGWGVLVYFGIVVLNILLNIICG